MTTPNLFESLLNRKPRASKKKRRRAVTAAIVAAALVLAIVILLKVLSMYVDWLWFSEVSLRTVFWTSLWSRVVVGVAAALIFFVLIWGNLELARRLMPSFRTSESGDVVELIQGRVAGAIKWGVLGASALMAIIAGAVASGRWMIFQKALHASSFGVKDPIFNHDLGFYVFTVPAWRSVQSFVFGALVATLVLTAILHLLMAGSTLASVVVAQPRGRGAKAARPSIQLRLPGRTVAHLSGLLGAIFVTVGVGQLFNAWNLLVSSGGGAAFGAGYTDVHARLPVARILMGLAFALAALLFWNIWRRRQWWPLTLAVWIGALIILRAIVPAVMQSLIVNPNQLAKERTYIGYTLESTRAAYNLEGISQKMLPLKNELTAQQLTDNRATIRNIRLWDARTLVTSYRQLQELRPYYSFADADVDRYTVNEVLRQTMLSPRELNIEGLPQQAQTWVNQHLTYTHGYGVALSAVNQVASDGSPDFLVKDIPPAAAAGLKIKQPRIYFGEIGTDYTLVGTQQQEFDYPGGTGDVYSSYKGSGGIQVSGFWRRLALCWRFKTIKFFTAGDITSQSRVIIKNNVRSRLAKAAPFLRFDKDPYMVIADGKLYWIVDGYTVTNRYPYSDPDGDINYIRNSVKAVVDAYNGTTTFYNFDPNDPILKTYSRIFPDMFVPADKMPRSLFAHVRYPEDYFNTQARMFATYHVTDPEVLYNKGDQWQIPSNVALSGAGPMEAYYVIMRLPGATKEEFLLMLPFVPNGRNNMVAWLAARSDPPNYGKSSAIVLSRGSTVYGPSQVEAAINQDPKVSAQLTLWNQRGSTAIMGNLLVVPIADGLLYVQPLYLQAEQTKVPQLKQVIVFYRSPTQQATSTGGKTQVVAMEPTLGEALADIFGASPTGPSPSPSPSPSGPSPSPSPSGPTALSAQARQLIARANQQFEAAQTALKNGDFASYGVQIAALQDTLRQLANIQ